MCDSCSAVRINGVLCHEHGCPYAWMDKKHECKWCGNEYMPEDASVNFCSEYCWRAYNGFEDDNNPD